MQYIREILLDFFVPPLTGAIIAAAAIGFGAVLAQLFFKEKRVPVIESFALGSCAISLLTLVWGMSGWMGPFSRWSLLLLLLLLGVTGWIHPGLEFGINIRSFRSRVILVFALLLLLSAVFKLFILALWPPLAPEECSTYLPAAQDLLKTGKIGFIFNVPLNGLPQNAEMLYTWAIMHSHLWSAHYVNFFAFIFSLLAIVRLGRTVFSLKTGWLAALFLGSLISIQWFACRAYPDMWVVFYLIAALMAGAEGFRYGDSRRIMLAGVFIGASAGSGYTGTIGGFALLLSLLALGRWKKTSEKSIGLEDIIIASFIAILVASPWYIRNIIWFHNPFFPFLSQIFPPGYGVYGKYALESTISLTRMMENFSVQHYLEKNDLWNQTVKLWPAWGSLITGIWFWRSSPFIRVMVTWTILTWAYWFVLGGGIMYSGFFLYLMPVTLLLGAHFARYIYTFPPGDERGRFIRVMMWVILIGWVGIEATRDQAIAPPLTLYERKELLAREINYDLIERANDYIPPNGRAVGVYTGGTNIYADFTLIGGNDWGYANHMILQDASISPETFASLLREHYKANYLVVNETRLNPLWGGKYSLLRSMINSKEFERYFQEVSRAPSGTIYYLKTHSP